jgi:ribonucleoside-triphosphate reductase (formate)
LVERGLEEARKRYIRLGFPIYDVHQIIENETNKDNANVPHGPEATNLTLAEGIKKEYALLRVFSPDVGDAHLKGDIHLHDLGMVDRPYCSGQSLEYVKKYGLDLNTSLSQANQQSIQKF